MTNNECRIVAFQIRNSTFDIRNWSSREVRSEIHGLTIDDGARRELIHGLAKTLLKRNAPNR